MTGVYNLPAISGIRDASQIRLVLFQSGRLVHAPMNIVSLEYLNTLLPEGDEAYFRRDGDGDIEARTYAEVREDIGADDASNLTQGIVPDGRLNIIADVLTSNSSTSSSSFVDVPLGFDVNSGETWFFHFFCYINGDEARLAINGPSASSIDYRRGAFRHGATSNLQGTSSATSYDDDNINLTEDGGGVSMAHLIGRATFTSAGTLTLRLKRNGSSGSATVSTDSQVWAKRAS